MLTVDQAGQALAEWLLVETVQQIRTRLSPDATLYERLMLSALVRRALIDGRPLADAARSRLRLPKPTFLFTPDVSIAPAPPQGPQTAQSRWVPMGQLGVPAGGGIEYTLKDFLRVQIGSLRGVPITVRSLVKYFANVYGGVHHGVPESDVERFFQQTLVSVEPVRSLMFDHLSRIAVSTADALEPIAEAVSASPLSCNTVDGSGRTLGTVSMPRVR